MFSFFPKNTEFGPKYHDAVKHIQDISTVFNELQKDWKRITKYRENAHMIEEMGDRTIRDIILSLNDSFITPFDREDMYTLADTLDDITDEINRTIEHTDIYHIKKARPYMGEFSELYMDAANVLEKIIRHLFDKNPEQESTAKLLILFGMLSGRSNTLYEESIKRLFDEEKDAIEIVKWENLIRDMHAIMATFKKAGRTIETIIMKVG